MMDHMLMGVYSRSYLGDYGHRCSRCGQGPVAASDGFMMAHCLNCGTYHAPAWDWREVDFGVARSMRKAKDKVFAWLKQLGRRIASKGAPTEQEALPSG